jgi:hypothetical protein
LLSRWLESGRWRFFGVYCIAFAIFVFALAAFGFWSGDRTCHWPIRENLMDAREDALSSVGAKSL